MLILGGHLFEVAPDFLMPLKRIAINHVVIFAVLCHEGHDSINVAVIVILIILLHHFMSIPLAFFADPGLCPLCL